MLPAQKHELPVMSFITKEEFNALIQVCDTNTFISMHLTSQEHTVKGIDQPFPAFDYLSLGYKK